MTYKKGLRFVKIEICIAVYDNCLNIVNKIIRRYQS